MIITLEDVKKHCRIDGNCEDDVLMLYATAAEETVLNVLDRTEEDLLEEYGKIPASIRQAMLMVVSNSYSHREPASATNLSSIPYTLEFLVLPYMKLV